MTELSDVIATFGGQVVYLPDAGVYGVQVRHRDRWIIAREAPDHPFEPTWVYLDPAPFHGHYYTHAGESLPRLCWCRPDEWNPRFPLLIAVGSAMRFLNEL